jgi:3-oxo-5-alpha-steroid 4-dehydrogenase 1
MTERTGYTILLIAWFILSAATSASLFFVVAPYGRHRRGGWGPCIDDGWGWVLMEFSGVWVFGLCFLLMPRASTPVDWIFLALWEGHYVYRAFIYPALRRDKGEMMPLSIVAMGILFNIGNGYLNGRYLFAFASPRTLRWLIDSRFFIGVVLFLGGFAAHTLADRHLRTLRRPDETGYKIPQGGLFRWVSAPNYLGEIVEWTGWALATWSLAGLSFALWTASNLAPRAMSHHRWYREHFPDYPPERKALLPGLW